MVAPVQVVVPGFAWTAKAVMPFDWQWSKNAMWVARAGSYARRLNPKARARKEVLAAMLRPKLPPMPLRKAPLWVLIDVGVPDRRGDAINCIDLVCDSVQLATGLDDRWYKTVLDWEVCREKPELEVLIGQEA